MSSPTQSDIYKYMGGGALPNMRARLPGGVSPKGKRVNIGQSTSAWVITNV